MRPETDLSAAAIAYAQRGWRVFPLHGVREGRCTCRASDCSSPAKHPLVRRGLHEATDDVERVTVWWTEWPWANVGLITGATSGVTVVDIDLGSRTNTPFGSPVEHKADPKPPDVFSSLARLVHRLPRTLTSLTGGGGVHLVYRSEDPDLRNGVGRLPGIGGSLPGIDLRANGGYIVVPPSVHSSGSRYSWLDPEVPIAEAPGWLKQPKRVYAPVVVAAPKFSSGDGTPYGLAALGNECARVRSAPVGTRNDQLYRSTRALARLVAAGELLELAARASLAEAGRCAGLGSYECYRTIASAFSHP